MNNKIQKYREELEKIEAKVTALKERGKALEQKIREAETLEICALMRNENLSMSELIALARSRTENREVSDILGNQADAADADDDRYTAMDQDADTKRRQYEEDEDEEDEDDE